MHICQAGSHGEETHCYLFDKPKRIYVMERNLGFIRLSEWGPAVLQELKAGSCPSRVFCAVPMAGIVVAFLADGILPDPSLPDCAPRPVSMHNHILPRILDDSRLVVCFSIGHVLEAKNCLFPAYPALPCDFPRSRHIVLLSCYALRAQRDYAEPGGPTSALTGGEQRVGCSAWLARTESSPFLVELYQSKSV